MTTVTLARHAMATRFEIVLHGQNAIALRAAGEEALDEIERLEAQLSVFQSSSEIAHLNASAPQEAVRVTPALFALLEHARRLSAETDGAFDITIAPLVQCWGFREGTGHQPDSKQIAAAREKVGMHLVEMDPAKRTVRFSRPGVALDLGAIGKGYAIERAAAFLREDGVESALIHGGTSTVYGLGHPPDAEAWMIAIKNPSDKLSTLALGAAGAPIAQSQAIQRPAPGDRENSKPAFPFVVALRDEALSVSAVWGKFFEAEGRLFGHVLNPLTGEPVNDSVLAAVALPSAMETDALSTALLVLGPAGFDRMRRLREGMRMVLASAKSGDFCVQACGITG